jgi:predicted short-subunit dehydrogenase-like oxidoreductase (DUF2520 family)
MTFAIIGSGNVATHFAIALDKNGHQVLQVYSRGFTNAQTLAQKVGANAITRLSQIHSSVEVIIIAVNDDAISIVLNDLNTYFPQKNPIIIHTSGTLPITILSATAKNYGVLYPLQTLSKNVEINFLNVPIAVEANNEETQQTLLQIANSISNLVYTINSHQRKTLHIAAVFACNFTNYFYAIADNLLQQNHLNFDMLKPLIVETVNKILTNSPQQVQTGPAQRNDKGTMNNHLSALSQHPQYQLLYKLISDGIVANNKKE